MLAAKINTHSKHSNTEWAKRITIDLFVHIYLLLGPKPRGFISVGLRECLRDQHCGIRRVAR